MPTYASPEVEDVATELRTLFPSLIKCSDRPALDPVSSDDSSQSSSEEDSVNSNSLSFVNMNDQSQKKNYSQEINTVQSFPSSCLKLVTSLPGNDRCVDCGAISPQWASISYGALLCLDCSGIHRSFGVSVSRVRSITMDSWSHSQILSMLEGGNHQLSTFFMRHSLGPHDNNNSSPSTIDFFAKRGARNNIHDITLHRYKTKAAKFYRENLAKHVERVKSHGDYKGRKASRRICRN